VGALLMEQDEVWTTGKRYFDMTAYWQWRERQSTQVALFQEVLGVPVARERHIMSGDRCCTYRIGGPAD